MLAAASILSILAAIRELSTVVNEFKRTNGMTHEDLIKLARQHDDELGDFVRTELASLDRSAVDK